MSVKKKHDYIRTKIQENQKRRQEWVRFASEKSSGQQSQSEKKGSEEESTGVAYDAIQNQGYILQDIKGKLIVDFSTAIKNLNATRNEFLQAKKDMALDAMQRPWERVSGFGGLKTFVPEALMAFKAKIRDMVVLEKKYWAEKAKLKQDMLAELRDILMEQLMEMGGNSSENLEPRPLGEQELAGTEAAVDAVLEQMSEIGSDTITDDVTAGLPFARTLRLAVAGSRPTSGADGGPSGGSVALVVIGALAIIASVAAVGYVGLKLRRRRALYARME